MIFNRRLFTLLLGLLFATVLNDQASALYDPGVGRFCSRDPIGYADGRNLLSFGGNAPVHHTDPKGTIKSTLRPDRDVLRCRQFAINWFIETEGREYYIVQKICFEMNAYRCSESWRNNRSCCEPYEKIGCSTCFYEVLIDPQEEGYAEKKAIDDWGLWMPRRDNRSRCDSNCVYIVSAEIRAFTANIPVKFGNRNAKPPIYDCGGYIDIDGDEDSQEAQPIWWDSHISSILKLASYKWRCCGPGQSETILRTPMENF